jgi:serine/threonine protein phosphatase 1
VKSELGERLASDPTRIYAIGDIHGCVKPLRRLVRAIEADLQESPQANCLTVTLGDYIDRGPASRDVIEFLVGNPFPTPYVALKGNHEALLERFLVEPEVAEDWRCYGGLETLQSYGVDVYHVMRGRHYDAAAEALAETMPPSHLGFIHNLRLSLALDRYFLCHAGVRPGTPLQSQTEEDLLWIREDFLRSKSKFGKVIVHGHSPVPEPEVRANRINVDTGAFITGRLTCAVLEGERVRFLSAA